MPHGVKPGTLRIVMKLDEDNVKDYAATLVAQVRAGDEEMASRLDFTERSVWALEALFRLSDAKFNDEATPDSAKEMTIFYGGCYLGEVLHRLLGGVWRLDEEEDWTDASLVFAHGEGGLQVFPFQKLIKRVTDGAKGNDLVEYFEGLKTRLSTS